LTEEFFELCLDGVNALFSTTKDEVFYTLLPIFFCRTPDMQLNGRSCAWLHADDAREGKGVGAACSSFLLGSCFKQLKRENGGFAFASMREK
jgi:hypothetical protein